MLWTQDEINGVRADPEADTGAQLNDLLVLAILATMAATLCLVSHFL
jgi:hypothetical protein